MTDRLVTEQPPPQANEKPAVWNLVLADMRARDAEGRRKYGVPLQPHNGRDAMIDLYQELLDAVVYARQAIYERDSAQPVTATMTAIEAGELATRAASAAYAQGWSEALAQTRQEAPTPAEIVAAKREGHDAGLQQGYVLGSRNVKATAQVAFQRGAEAMREAAAKECWKASDELADIPDMTTEQGELQIVATRIRALPIPSDSL